MQLLDLAVEADEIGEVDECEGADLHWKLDYPISLTLERCKGSSG